MPKAFEEFSAKDMEQIRKQIETVIDFNKLLGNTRSIRIDNNADWFVLEYKRQNELVLSMSDYNSPNLSVNIKNDFSCIVIGFDSPDEALIRTIVINYLKANSFDV